MAASLGFPGYEFCADSGQPGCYLNPSSRAEFDFKSYRFGFHTGGGHGDGSDNLLDFGERYSVDRCSKHHDAPYWSKDSCENNVSYVQCVDRVRPETAAERKAKAEVLAAFRTIGALCIATIAPRNTLSSAGCLTGEIKQLVSQLSLSSSVAVQVRAGQQTVDI